MDDFSNKLTTGEKKNNYSTKRNYVRSTWHSSLAEIIRSVKRAPIFLLKKYNFREKILKNDTNLPLQHNSGHKMNALLPLWTLKTSSTK